MLDTFLQVVASHAGHRSPPGSGSVFSATQALTVLITIESLMFAALNAGVVMSTPVAGGRNITRSGAFKLALGAVGALTLVAASALLAWWQVFVDEFPDSGLRFVQGLGIALGIVVQPIVSFIVALGVRQPKGG